MKHTLQDGTLVVELEGRIDSNNADAVDDELAAIVDQTAATRVTLDAENLSYISSAGLRVIMRLLKRLERVVLVNASPEVYDVFDMTGFAEMMEVRRALRTVSTEGLELLGSGANGSVYRLSSDQMIKVFRPEATLEDIEAERTASRAAFTLGVPCAISFDTVRCEGGLGTVYEMLDAATVTERIRALPASLESYAVETAKLLRELHALEVPEGVIQSAAKPYYARLEQVSDNYTAEETAQMRSLYDAIAPMSRFVHNDYHPKNIMDSAGELMLIDLGEAGTGNPLFDLMHTYIVFNLMGMGAGSEHAEDDMSFVGLTYGELHRFWRLFLATYCGSDERGQRLSELLGPFGLMTYLNVSMAHPLLPKEYHPAYVEKMRTLVLPRAQEMRASIEELQSFVPEH